MIFRPMKMILKRLLRFPVRQTQIYIASIINDWNRPKQSEDLSTHPARVASFERNDIIVLDYSMPMPDRDAGSRNTLEHMESLLSLGHKVFFWPMDRLYHPKYARILRKAGIVPVAGYVRPSLRAWLRRRKADIRFALLDRPQVASRYLDDLRAAGVQVVYYGHDLHFARLMMEADLNPSERLSQEIEDMKRLERSIWRRVNVSSYPSEEEIVELLKIEPTATARVLLPFCYDLFPQRAIAPSGSDIMFVGNFRHPPNVRAARFLATEVFPLIRKEIPSARLVIAGAYATSEITALEGDAVRVAGWLSDEELEALYMKSRLAIVPLQVGAGMKLKVVEALMHGTPLVTTTVGAQGIHGLDKILPVRDDAAGIARAAVDLLKLDDDGWLAQARTEIQYAEGKFSREAMTKSLADAFELASQTKPLE